MANQAMVQRPSAQAISGTFSDPARIGALLENAAKSYHLVTSATTCGSLPEGCELSFSSVLVDKAETYPIPGGKLGLGKPALDRIANAAGVSWDPYLTKRLDDGSHPHYCMFVAVCRVRQFDGTEKVSQGTKELDLREGSATVQTSSASELPMLRKHIVSRAETCARLRAIRSLGIRTSYSAEDLAKPFVVVRMIFSGRTNDPELRRIFAEKRADAMLGASQALYGGPVAAMLPAAAPAMRPPPVGARPADDDDDFAPESPRQAQAPQQSVPRAPAASAPAPAPAQAQGAPAAAQTRPPTGGNFTIPGGRDKGLALADADDSSLGYWADRIEKAVAAGTSRDAERDAALAAAMRAEQERRNGDPEPNDRGSDPEKW